MMVIIAMVVGIIMISLMVGIVSIDSSSYGMIYNISGIPMMHNSINGTFEEVITPYHISSNNTTVLTR